MAKLLIVDDEIAEVRPLMVLLRQEGHDVCCATTPGEALTELQHNPPDLILLDLNMPHLNGFDLLDAIEDDSRFFDVPVAIYSGLSDEASIARAMKLGACDYIVKGMNWDQTYQRIKAHLPTTIDEPAIESATETAFQASDPGAGTAAAAV
jgi:PleD family two-component response regulator